MTSSSLPAVTAALVELLEMASGLEGVTIAHIAAENPSADGIIVGAAESTRQFKALGALPTPLDEEFTVECAAAAVMIGATSWTAPQARAYELLEAAENALRSDYKLGGLVRWITVSRVKESFEAVDKGRAASVRFWLTGKTRI